MKTFIVKTFIKSISSKAFCKRENLINDQECQLPLFWACIHTSGMSLPDPVSCHHVSVPMACYSTIIVLWGAVEFISHVQFYTCVLYVSHSLIFYKGKTPEVPTTSTVHTNWQFIIVNYHIRNFLGIYEPYEVKSHIKASRIPNQ